MDYNVEGMALPGRWWSVTTSRYMVEQPTENFSSTTHQEQSASGLTPEGTLVQPAIAVERTSLGRQSMWWNIYGKDYTNERTRFRPVRCGPWSKEIRKDPRRRDSVVSKEETGGIRLRNAFSSLDVDDQQLDVNEPPPPVLLAEDLHRRCRYSCSRLSTAAAKRRW